MLVSSSWMKCLTLGVSSKDWTVLAVHPGLGIFPTALKANSVSLFEATPELGSGSSFSPPIHPSVIELRSLREAVYVWI